MALNEQPSNPPNDAGADAAAATADPSPRQLLDSARRAMALKQYDSATDQLATVLELLRDSHGEDHESLAPILHLYGRALLESAIANSGALGGGGSKDAPMPSKTKASAVAGSSSSSNAAAAGSSAKTHDPRFSFSGDAESDDEEEPDAAGGADGAAEEEEEEDDLGVAFSVLDLARVIYQRALDAQGGSKTVSTLDGQTWDETKVKAELAEVLNDLGDVGLESENFQQASSDYQACLTLLTPLLHPHSRRLADAHLRLGLALEFHPTVSEREGAIRHVKAASEVLATRLSALEERRKAASSLPVADSEAPRVLENVEEARAEKIDSDAAPTPTADADANGKGKGKAADATGTGGEGSKLEKDDILSMTSDQVELELKDVREMKEELDTKLDEYESPSGLAKLSGQPDVDGVAGTGGVATSTKAALEQAIAEAFLGGTGGGEGSSASASALGGVLRSAAASDAPVNDLSKMVKRKKKAPESEPAVAAAAAAAVDNDDEGSSRSKKAKVEDA